MQEREHWQREQQEQPLLVVRSSQVDRLDLQTFGLVAEFLSPMQMKMLFLACLGMREDCTDFYDELFTMMVCLCLSV